MPCVIHCNSANGREQEADRALQWSRFHTGGVTTGTGRDGNVSVNPDHLTVAAPDPSLWDLHLSTTSRLVDAGDPTILDPDGSPSDIGVYGGPGADLFDLDGDGSFEWWQPGPYDAVRYPALGWDCDDLDGDVFPGAGC